MSGPLSTATAARRGLALRLGGALACGFLLTGVSPNLRAQELSFLGGAVAPANLENQSYSWQLDYREYFGPNWAASLDWINEGHLPGHSPDGLASEGWYRVPLDGGRLSLSVGAGPYFYFDTEMRGRHGSIDAHGFAPIFSGSLSGRLVGRWSWRFTYNRINPPTSDIKVNTVAAGVGYWFGSGLGPANHRPSAADDPPFEPENTLTIYGGWRVSNTRMNRQTLAEALEYRRSLTRHLDATTSFIYEGDPAVVRRSGLAAQLWPTDRFASRWGLTVGMGIGAYVYLDKKSPQKRQNPGAAGGVVSPMIAKRFGTSPWSARLLWNRIITNYDRDSDVWMLGFGYSWR